jgi:argininosuccinate lyase
MSVLTTKRQPSKGELLSSFTNGVKPDSELYKQEIAVQRAWARGLNSIGILDSNELTLIEDALLSAFNLMETGQFDWREEDEDIHMNLERFVNEKTAGLGKKMHAGRSRNDLIATTLKLHVADSASEIIHQIQGLIQVMVELAEKNLEIIMPGMTHLQNGQPVRWSHALLAHAWAFHRDITKFTAVKTNALKTMPLGSAALSGTTLDIDLISMSKTLGFAAPSMNSYDSVGERDSIVDFLQAAAHFGVHLSRLCEDVIYWSSAPVGLIELSPLWSTGSSIMPNKRNPDVAELARAKASLWMGDASGVMTLIKGLPTCYASDLHESKLPYLSVVKDVKLSLSVFTPFLAELKLNQAVASKLLNQGHILATEFANHLVDQGLPFREAYAAVAAMVELAESKQQQIHQLSYQELQLLAPQLDAAFLQQLSFGPTVEKRSFAGGTALSEIRKQIKALSTRPDAP